MAISITGIVALVLTVTGVGLLASGGILTEFVDVFIVEDVDSPTSGEPVAGVGIFSAVYDASVLSENTLSESGVPDDEFETPTLSFPLLFPCQENFVLDVLPIQAADVESFENDQLTALVQSAVDAVDIGFEDCESYTTDIFTGISAYWTTLETFLFPEVLAAVDAGVRASVGASGFAGIGSGLNETVSDVLLASCGSLSLTLEADGFGLLCLEGIENETLIPLTTYADLCEETDNLEDCFLTKTSYDLVDANLSETIAFTLDDDDVGSICDVLFSAAFCSSFTNEDYITFLVASATSLSLDGATGLQIYANFLGDFEEGSLSSITSLTSVELAIDTDVTSLNESFYAGCETLVLLGAADANCTFATYLPTAAALSGDSTVAALSELYEGCVSLSAALGFDSTCPDVFGRVVVDGALQGDLQLDDNAGLAFESIAIARALETCENNDIDNEKIAQSQTFVIVAYIAHSIAVLAGVAGLLLDVKVATFSVAGVAAIAGGFLTFGALLTVQSAPVYDGVGGEAVEFEAIFVEGKVVAIALADFLIMIVAGITFFVAAYFGRGAGSAVEEPEEEEKKEVVAAKAAEPEELEVAEVKAEEETKDDVVPGTNVAI